jgi:uncharacterized membrane protein
MESTAFKLRRVLLGVIAGLLLVALGFYGWVQYRRSEYQHRQQQVVARYQRSFTLCSAAGTTPALCVDRVLDACMADPFWRVAKPFSFDAGVAAPDPVAGCRKSVVTR